jgi:hypothetical protein
MYLPPVRRRFQTLCLVAVAVACLVPSHAVRANDPAIAEFSALQDLVARLPLPNGIRTSLGSKLAAAERSHLRGQSCTAANQLGALLNETQALRQALAFAGAEHLYNRARSLRDSLRAPPSPCADPRAGMAPAVSIAESDNRKFKVLFAFGLPSLETFSSGGEVWTRLTIPGLEEGGEGNGYPGLPVFRRLLAVPHGASAAITSVAPRVAEIFNANLFPYQPFRYEISTAIDDFEDTFPPRELYAEQPFFKNARSYEQNAALPPSPCRLQALGAMRDLQVALLECTAGRYNPATDVVTLFSDVDVTMAFNSGDAAPSFLHEHSLSPFEPTGRYASALLNGDVVSQYVSSDVLRPVCTGEELLILTHPTYRPAALALADWKEFRGILTSVVDVNDGGGPGRDTREEIDTYIDGRYRNCSLRPSYILLLGDAADVPTWVMQRLNKPRGDTVATDFPYATFDKDPFALTVLPDFAVSRIPVNSLLQAQTVVDKVILYESAPPTMTGFYRDAMIASYHQCCRTDVMGQPGVENGRAFIQNAEFLRASLLGRGFGVDRIYNTSTAYHPEYTQDPTPLAFANATALPTALLPPFMWPGTAADISAAFNAGRSLIFHIDHGYTAGWGDPHFSTSDLSALTNGPLLPVLFNMNCNSGNFEGSSFSERILRMSGGGAIGVFGWTRMSNTLYYRALLEGTLDAFWPGTLPSFGGAWINSRLGDLFNHSRLYMATVHGGLSPLDDGFNNAINHVRLYHAFGDPTLEIWTDNPFELPPIELIEIHPLFINIPYAIDGTVMTVLQRTREEVVPIGRATVVGGIAHVQFFMTPVDEGSLFVAATKPNAVGASASVR